MAEPLDVRIDVKDMRKQLVALGLSGGDGRGVIGALSGGGGSGASSTKGISDALTRTTLAITNWQGELRSLARGRGAAGAALGIGAVGLSTLYLYSERARANIVQRSLGLNSKQLTRGFVSQASTSAVTVTDLQQIGNRLASSGVLGSLLGRGSFAFGGQSSEDVLLKFGELYRQRLPAITLTKGEFIQAASGIDGKRGVTGGTLSKLEQLSGIPRERILREYIARSRPDLAGNPFFDPDTKGPGKIESIADRLNALGEGASRAYRVTEAGLLESILKAIEDPSSGLALAAADAKTFTGSTKVFSSGMNELAIALGESATGLGAAGYLRRAGTGLTAYATNPDNANQHSAIAVGAGIAGLLATYGALKGIGKFTGVGQGIVSMAAEAKKSGSAMLRGLRGGGNTVLMGPRHDLGPTYLPQTAEEWKKHKAGRASRKDRTMRAFRREQAVSNWRRNTMSFTGGRIGGLMGLGALAGGIYGASTSDGTPGSGVAGALGGASQGLGIGFTAATLLASIPHLLSAPVVASIAAIVAAHYAGAAVFDRPDSKNAEALDSERRDRTDPLRGLTLNVTNNLNQNRNGLTESIDVEAKFESPGDLVFAGHPASR